MPQAAIPIAAEAAVASTLTAAEIAAAQAAAAELAAAQAAAAQAAAAQTVAATNASVLSAIAPTAAPAAATTATTAGAGAGAGTGAGGLADLTVNLSGDPTLAEMLKTVPEGTVSSFGSTPASTTLGTGTNTGVQALANEVMPGVQTTLTEYAPGALESSALPSALPPAIPPAPTVPGLPGLQTDLASMGSNLPPPITPPAPPPITPPAPPTNVAPGGEQMRNATTEYLRNTAGNANLISSLPAPPAAEPNFLQELYKDFKGMSMPNKLITGMLASNAYDTLNRPKPYEPKKYKSTFNSSAYSGYQPVQPTPYTPHYAQGGLADLGGYSDYARGGRMLKGPGDGMSDDIPATIANKQPARLANEEFVIPADVVSHLGNGSSEAGAKVLYKMMDRVRQARTGNKKQGKQINPEKYLA